MFNTDAREFHYSKAECNGKRSNRLHRTGKTKTWKTRPGEFRIPVKFGMFGPYSYLTQNDLEDYHDNTNCPFYRNSAQTSSLYY